MKRHADRAGARGRTTHSGDSETQKSPQKAISTIGAEDGNPHDSARSELIEYLRKQFDGWFDPPLPPFYGSDDDMRNWLRFMTDKTELKHDAEVVIDTVGQGLSAAKDWIFGDGF